MITLESQMYEGDIADLRSLLTRIGRSAFRQAGYAKQLRHYRALLRST